MVRIPVPVPSRIIQPQLDSILAASIRYFFYDVPTVAFPARMIDVIRTDFRIPQRKTVMMLRNQHNEIHTAFVCHLDPSLGIERGQVRMVGRGRR